MPPTELEQVFNEYHFHPKAQALFNNISNIYSDAYLVVDDSGSMGTCDGNYLDFRVKHPVNRIIPRSDELAAEFELILNILYSSSIRTTVSFLNKSTTTLTNREQLTTVLTALRYEPSGATPLCTKLNAIYEEINARKEAICNANKKVLLLISSDGEASDGNLSATVQQFKNLPVTIVVRICSSEKDIIKYWNKVEKDIEMKLDIVDDIITEAKQFEKLNDWFRYNYPIHILRQCGLTITDRLDEAKLDKNERNNFICKFLQINPSVYNKSSLKAENYKVYSITEKKEKSIIAEGKIFGWFD